LESKLLFSAEVLVKNLEYELGNECLDMLLVLVLGIDPLNVHLAHVGLILIAQLVHSSDEVVALVGQVLQLVVQCHLVLPVLDLFASQVLELGLQVPNPAPSRLMVRLQPFQIVALPDQVRVDVVCFALDLPGELLFLPELVQERILLNFKSVEFFTELAIQITLILQIVLQVTIHDILQAGDLL